MASVSQIVAGNHLIITNRGPEEISLTNVTTVDNLLVGPTGLEGGGVSLLPGERHEILLAPPMGQSPYVEFNIEYIDNTGTTTRTVRLKV
jgi:hypothetical protein